MRIEPLLILIFCAALVGLTSYGLALWGEPSAVWLWRDMFGILQ